MAARVDAVSQRVQTAVTMQQVSMSMKGVVKSMDRAMASMNLTQLSQLMDKFEKVGCAVLSLDLSPHDWGLRSAIRRPGCANSRHGGRHVINHRCFYARGASQRQLRSRL